VLDTSPEATRKKLNYDHVICPSEQTINNMVKLMLDTGSEVNIIKISALKDDTMVYENTILSLAGITEHLTRTLGTTILQLKMGSILYPTEFHVVQSVFPIPHDGLLGKPFIIGRETILNFKTKELILTDPSDIELQPRTETLIAIPFRKQEEGEIFLIPAQNITETVICCNTINKVQSQQILISVINPTEYAVTISRDLVGAVQFEKFEEAKIHAIQQTPENLSIQNRIPILEETLKMEHLNQEERESLLDLR